MGFREILLLGIVLCSASDVGEVLGLLLWSTEGNVLCAMVGVNDNSIVGLLDGLLENVFAG